MNSPPPTDPGTEMLAAVCCYRWRHASQPASDSYEAASAPAHRRQRRDERPAVQALRIGARRRGKNCQHRSSIRIRRERLPPCANRSTCPFVHGL